MLFVDLLADVLNKMIKLFVTLMTIAIFHVYES